MALIRAWNKRRKHWQTVPESYVTTGRFGGVFAYPKDAPKSASETPPKNSRRKAGTAETPQATGKAATPTEQAPASGDHDKE